jgi:tripartite-type tricarboxylate transporter receptor subunit TctC
MRSAGMSRRRILRWSACFALPTLLSQVTRAAEWKPSRPIEMLISYSAGGGADALGRYVNTVLASKAGWTVLAVNKPGAGGALMLRTLQKAAPYGQTVGLCLSLQLAQPPAADSPPFSLDDFTLLAGLARGPMALVTTSDNGFNDIPSMRQYSMREKRPIMLGSTPGLDWVASRIASALDIEVVGVPFKGGAEMLQNLLGGHIDLFLSGGSHLTLERAGKLRVVAAATRDRLPTSPDAPSLYEQGIKVVIESRFIVLGPKNMPREVASALSREFAAMMNDPAVRKYLESNLQIISAYLGPEDLKSALTAELALQK